MKQLLAVGGFFFVLACFVVPAWLVFRFINRRAKKDLGADLKTIAKAQIGAIGKADRRTTEQ